jgi:hypothetical protein
VSYAGLRTIVPYSFHLSKQKQKLKQKHKHKQKKRRAEDEALDIQDRPAQRLPSRHDVRASRKHGTSRHCTGPATPTSRITGDPKSKGRPLRRDDQGNHHQARRSTEARRLHIQMTNIQMLKPIPGDTSLAPYVHCSHLDPLLKKLSQTSTT